ncbi:MAG: type II secretion system protein [Oscillospiraceae bacterium]|nr:type II secretion system protein [Oscillospiraceae bacterium]
MKNKILKGFTLVELIVVIAIFSILMTGALALVDPF